MDALLETLRNAKAEGNSLFAGKRFEEAIATYTSALNAAAHISPNDDIKDDLRLVLSQLYSNRSAVHHDTGKAQLALEDANQAVKYAYPPRTPEILTKVLFPRGQSSLSATSSPPIPSWTKPLLRQGAALEALGRIREAATAYEIAKSVEPHDPTAIKLFKAADSAAKKVDKVAEITCVPHFLEVFRKTDARLRLATLATFWNLSTSSHRHSVFKQFLFIVAGPAAVDESITGSDVPAPHISHFPPGSLTALPMDNYADVTVPSVWTSFYEACDEEKRVQLFNGCWDICSMGEQDLIVRDIRTFFVPSGDAAQLEDAAPDTEDASSSTVPAATPRPLPVVHSQEVRQALENAGSSGTPLRIPSEDSK